jgi:hypothetical protein
LLHAAGNHAGLVDRVPLALVRDARLAQQLVEHGHEFGEPAHPRAGRQQFAAEHGGVETRTARTQAEDHAPIRHVVERHHLLREVHRMPEVRR